MFLIIGLGNVGNRYKYNRHNVGFLSLDYLLDNDIVYKKRKKYLYYKVDSKQRIYIKPTTYMNLSGEAIISAMTFFKVPLENILIIYDDVDLPLGKIRIRDTGSNGGHNGLKSIEQNIGNRNYKRIRIGIGLPKFSGQMIRHVLGDFSKDDLSFLNDKIFPVVEESVDLITNNKLREAMNKYNGINFAES